jgi:large subunit ribosomal protein L18
MWKKSSGARPARLPLPNNMNKDKAKQLAKAKRAARIGAKIHGTPERPRLSVFKSNTYMFAQIIDDTAGRTLVSAHSKGLKAKDKTTAGFELGKALAAKAKAAGIGKVVFDRGSNLYHGRIKAIADGAREGGLEF